MIFEVNIIEMLAPQRKKKTQQMKHLQKRNKQNINISIIWTVMCAVVTCAKGPHSAYATAVTRLRFSMGPTQSIIL